MEKYIVDLIAQIVTAILAAWAAYKAHKAEHAAIMLLNGKT